MVLSTHSVVQLCSEDTQVIMEIENHLPILISVLCSSNKIKRHIQFNVTLCNIAPERRRDASYTL